MPSIKRAVTVAVATGAIVGATAAAAFGEPPKGQGYFKDVNGGGAGASECAGPHPSQLAQGQAKKC